MNRQKREEMLRRSSPDAAQPNRTARQPGADADREQVRGVDSSRAPEQRKPERQRDRLPLPD